MPRCVVVDEAFDWGGDAPPHTPLADTVVYEAHVRSLTMRHPEMPEHLRGTYAGLAHPSVIEHLTGLGVTAVELLPVQAFTSEPEVLQRGLTNHWGYNTLGFFAPHAAYAAHADPQGVLDEFKGMVELLHAAGIEVLLDVVYNHTAEQQRERDDSLPGAASTTAPTTGSTSAATTSTSPGCGNTLDLRHPMVCRMVLDSLRYWVEECHVDGFRFDLAVALARGRYDDYDPNHPFLVALRDRSGAVPRQAHRRAVGRRASTAGGPGQFPPPFAEWNDRFRDARPLVLARPTSAAAAGHHQGHGVQDLATRLAGSQDLFGTRDRGPIASVNFVAAHDGFTAADLTRYDSSTTDPTARATATAATTTAPGTTASRVPTSGPADPVQEVAAALASATSWRRCCSRPGVPMLNAGDEFGRSQGGNNNAYCQDNETSWFDWDLEPWQQDLLETTRHLVRLRADHPVLRQRTFPSGRQVARGRVDRPRVVRRRRRADGERPVGGPVDRAASQMLLNGAWLGQSSLLVVLHGAADPEKVTLPEVPGLTAYQLLWDSTDERPGPPTELTLPGPVEIGPTCIRVYRATDAT